MCIRDSLKSDPALVLNGDSYCDVDLGTFAEAHGATGADASLVVTQVSDVSRFGRVLLDDVGRVTSFEEKGAASGRGWINAGVYLLGQDVLSSIPQERVS